MRKAGARSWTIWPCSSSSCAIVTSAEGMGRLRLSLLLLLLLLLSSVLSRASCNSSSPSCAGLA